MAQKHDAGAPPAYAGSSPSPYPPQQAHMAYAPPHPQAGAPYPPQGYAQQPPPGGYYQQGYQQGPPMGYQQHPVPPQGQYVGERRGDSDASGCLAALCAALACCCCLDCLF